MSTSLPAAPAAGRRAARPPPALGVHRVSLALRPDLLDPAGRSARLALREAGLGGAEDVRVVRAFFLEGDLAPEALRRAVTEVLADPVLDVAAVDADVPPGPGPAHVVTVMKKAGVTDAEAETAAIALRAVGLPVARVHTAREYRIRAAAEPGVVLAAARRTLGNDVIEDVVAGAVREHRFPSPGKAAPRRVVVRIRRLAGPALEALSREMGLSLSRAEMEAIRAHFRVLGREPTDVELETLAQTWSEHCKHKTLAGAVRMKDEDGSREYENLLKETIFAATERLDRPWCWSVFQDNAGVVDFDGEDGVCMKVETHNHPSAIEPYGGAGTGIGGVIRDILGTGKGARPVANTDVFCFGPPDLPPGEVPRGCLPPLRILRGVVSGVRDYGNRMGIPTVNGAICFDPRYVGNPVVYCGSVGIIPRKDVRKAAKPGDYVVAFGGRTGRDGIHGATFSSVGLHAKSETVSSGAVQIGDAITEKKVRDVLLRARELGLFHAVTDCGAGGFSSAVGEMGEATGADVDLAAAPLKYPGLTPAETWISEAQERMVAAVPPKKWPRFRDLCASEDVEAVVLGKFTRNRRLKVRHGKTRVADLEMEFLHHGLPRATRDASWTRPALSEPEVPASRASAEDLLALLRMPQIGSKEWVIRQYDHEVQAGAVVRPLAGPHHGPSDGAVVAPKLGSRRGIVLANGINPAYGDLDPYAMALLAVDEAIRNAVCVGADPARLAILDNFTWGSCDDPEVMGAIVRAAEGCRDAALLFGTPFVSGKDSLHNEFRTEDGRRIRVPHTLLVSALGVIPDVRRTATLDLKRPGDLVYVVGATWNECGGSHWYRLLGAIGRNVPVVRRSAPNTMRVVSSLVRRGLVRAAHDPSEGGLAVAAAEMAFAGPHGLTLDLWQVPGDAEGESRLLFSETPTRFLLEVDPKRAAVVEGALAKAQVPFGRAGEVTEEPVLRVRSRTGNKDALSVPTADLRAAWRSALDLDRETSR